MERYNIDSVGAYGEIFGKPMPHPLVGVVDFDGSEQYEDHISSWGLYVLFLKKTKGCVINYGKTEYDYDDETVVSFAPGQVTETHKVPGITPQSIGLLIHPDYLLHTPLASKMKEYSFFSYSSNEALHLSPQEKVVITQCMNHIKEELGNNEDKYSKTIIISNIELLLDYCMRFYARQFDTREKINASLIAKFETLLDDYLSGDTAKREGLPNVAYFANKLFLSPNYFGDLVKKETGHTAQEYVQQKVIREAKTRLLNGEYNVSEIAYSLGFQYPQHFIRFFKRRMGITPKQYQMAN